MIASREDGSAGADGRTVVQNHRLTVSTELGGVGWGHYFDLSGKGEGVESIRLGYTFVVHAVVPVRGDGVPKNRV